MVAFMISQEQKELHKSKLSQLSTGYNKSTKPYCLDAGHTLHFLQIIKTNLHLPRLSLKVEYPPPINVLSTIAKADVNGVNKAMSQFNWQDSFASFVVNEQFNFLNSTLKFFFLMTSQIRQ